MTMPAGIEYASKPHRVWLGYLDGWRGLSVIAVLAAHFLPIPVINSGRLGVEAFFGLSGRLMASILFIGHYPLDSFIYRRITRVWPALYAFVLLVALAQTAPGPNQIRAVDVIGAFTFTANYTGIYVHRSPAFDHLWSLAVEEWSYLFLALLALGCRRLGWRPVPILLTVAIMCIINGIFQTALGLDYYAVYWRTDVRMASILVPCAIFLHMRGKPVSHWVPIIAACIGVILNMNRVPDPIKYSIGTVSLGVAIATIDFAPAAIRKFLSVRWLRMVGLWSFSLYLWQQPFAKAEGNYAINFLLAFSCALLSFYILENPARNFLNRWTFRRARIDESK